MPFRNAQIIEQTPARLRRSFAPAVDTARSNAEFHLLNPVTGHILELCRTSNPYR
jgi:hypothetical protein